MITLNGLIVGAKTRKTPPFFFSQASFLLKRSSDNVFYGVITWFEHCFTQTSNYCRGWCQGGGRSVNKQSVTET